jgi:hypothetical protein
MKITALVTTLAAAALLAGCANSPTVVTGREDLLAESGFTTVPSSSPTYAAAAQHLPPHRFAHHVAAGVTTYYYLDPTVCGCLYTGTAQNWAAYRKAVAEKLHVEAEESVERNDIPFDGPGG